ncbi:MAG TPA: ATP-binding protein [Pyrinomonadaceae bacterium]|nr:ATP-binding protein [Pyrinomonadaceae bacterium]
MSLKFERKLPAILLIVFVAITVIGFGFYQNTVSMQGTVEMERRTQRILAKLDEIQTSSVDIDTSTNGFIVTGNETYLNGYNRAKLRIPQDIGELRNLLSTEPQQIELMDQIQTLADKRLEFAANKVESRKQQGHEATVGLIGNPGDISVGANLRSTVEAVKAEAVRSLQRKELSSDRSFSLATWILIFGSIAGIIALTLANRVVTREMGQRKKAEEALTDANKDLENKIDERTLELKQVNEVLLEIGGEREMLLLNEKSARQEAELANRLRDEFMATVSHELRTPLNAILGWARLMKDGSLDEQQRTRAVSTIIKNSETQKRLIEDLLDVTRVISGKLELETEDVDPSDLLVHAAESIRPAAEYKRIEVECKIDDAIKDVRLSGDKHRLAQVLSNLLTNAIKFTPEGGAVSLAAELNNDEIVVDVMDNGVGINADFLPYVFERFRQDTSSVSKNGGLGLGLAIVRSLVELHGGSVAVQSDGENKGAKFTVRLPVKSSTAAVAPQRSVLPHPEDLRL